MNERTKKDNLIRGSIWNFIGTFLRLVLGIFGSILFVRYLGDDRYGVSVYLADMALFIVVIASLGLGTLQAKLLPELRTKNQAGQYKFLIIHNLLIRYGALIGLLFFVSILKVFKLISAFSLFGDYYNFFIIFSVLQISLAILRGPLQQEYEQKFVNLLDVYALLARIILVLPVIYFDLGLEGFLWTEVVVELWQLVLLLIKFNFRIWKDLRKVPKEVFNGKLLSISIPIFLVDFSSRLFGKEIDVILLGFFSGIEALSDIAVYSLSFVLVLRAFSFLGLGTASTATLLMSYSSDLISSGKHEKIPVLIEKQLKMLMIAVIPMTIGGVLLGDQMLKIMYGDAFSGNGWIIGCLFVGFGISSISYITKPLLLTLGQEKIILRFRLIVAIFKIALCCILIPYFGIRGLCLITAASIGIVSIIEMLLLNGKLQYSIPLQFVIRVIVANLCMGIFIILFMSYAEISTFIMLFLIVVYGITIYLLLLYILKPLSRDDAELLNGFLIGNIKIKRFVEIFTIRE